MRIAPEPVDRSGLARRGGLNLIGAVMSAALNLGLVVVVTRTLSVSDAGAFFAITSLFVLLLGLARLGSPTGLVFWVSRLRALGRGDLLVRCLRVALLPVVMLSVVLGCLLFAGADLVGGILVGGDSVDTDAAVGAIRALAIFLPFAALLEGVLGAMRGHHRMQPTVMIEKVGRPLLQVVAVLAVASLGLAAVSVAWAAPYVPALLIGSGWLTRMIRRRPPAAPDPVTTPEPEGGDLPTRDTLARRYWAFTAPTAASGLIQVVLQRLDVLLVTVLVDAGTAALYVAASRLLVLGAFGIQAVSMAIQPQLASRFAAGRLGQVADLYATSTTWLVLLTWPVYLVGLVHGPTVLSVFGPGYAEGYPVLVILVAATLFSTACGVVGDVLAMAGRSTLLLLNTCVALVANVGLNLVLIPRMGIEGAAIAWAASIVLNNLLPLIQVRREFGLAPFGGAVGLAAGVAVVSWIVPGVVLILVLGPGPPALLLSALVALGLYAALLWRFRVRLAVDELAAAVVRPRRGDAADGETRPRR